MNTKNWNQLATDGSEVENYHLYDSMIAAALEVIRDLSKDGIIRLYRFNDKDKAHMCILRIALIARDIFQFPIEVDASWWTITRLNWRLYKHFGKVKRFKLKIGENDDRGVNVPMMIDGFRAIADASFKEIYEAYYEGDM